MRSILVLVALAAATAWVVVRHLPVGEAVAEGKPANAREIQSVAIDGPRGLPLAALRDVLTTHPGTELDTNQLVIDRSALEAALEARGYLAARVEPATVTFAPTGGAYITFPIDPGPVYKLRDVRVLGTATAVDASVVTLSEGDDAIASRIERARQTLADNLERRGKPVSVTLVLRTDAAAAAVDVDLVSK